MQTKRMIAAAALSIAASIPAVAQNGDTSAITEDTVLGATFAVTATINPNTDGVAYCGGTALPVIVEAHGSGYSARFGSVAFFLQKTIDAPPGGAMHGCLTVTNPEGDALHFIYDGTYGNINANNFGSGSGTLTVTSGKGRFYGLKGVTVPFTASFYIAPPTVTAYYSLQ